LIVSSRDAKRIADGRKVQHRVSRSLRAPLPEVTVPITYREPNEALGFTSEGLPRSEPIRACRVLVTARWTTTLATLTDSDAEAEGYTDADELRLELGEPPAETKFWVIRFCLDETHIPRLLTSAVVAGRQGAYVDHPMRALPDEPEAVDSVTQTQLTEAAHYRDAEFRERRWNAIRLLSFDMQLHLLRKEAWRRHIDIRDELRAIDRWRNDRAREKQLEAIRRKLEACMVAA